MQEKEYTPNSSILKPFLAGGLIGASIGLLAAPKPGKALRKDVIRIANTARDEISDAVDKGRRILDDGKAAVADAAETGRKAIDEGRRKLEILTGRRKRSVVVPVLAAGAIGAAVALLYTTQKGKEIRADMKEVVEGTLDRAGAALDRGKELFEQGKDAVVGTLEAGQKAVHAGREKLRQVI